MNTAQHYLTNLSIAVLAWPDLAGIGRVVVGYSQNADLSSETSLSTADNQYNR